MVQRKHKQYERLGCPRFLLSVRTRRPLPPVQPREPDEDRLQPRVVLRLPQRRLLPPQRLDF